MKYTTFSQATVHDNSSTCTVHEYGAGGNIDMAVANINGRYPEHGSVVNEVSDEAMYVIAGAGQIATNDTTVTVSEGDVVLIEAGEAYYFEGAALKVAMSCTPPWSPDQHKEIA